MFEFHPSKVATVKNDVLSGLTVALVANSHLCQPLSVLIGCAFGYLAEPLFGVSAPGPPGAGLRPVRAPD